MVNTNFINSEFLSPMRVFTPLTSELPTYLVAQLSESLPKTVTVFSVFNKLTKLNPNKASGPDGIPAWLLKDNALLLAAPIADILNSSFQERRLPKSWKRADINPIPKKTPVLDVNKHLRPISLTPILSKVAEDYVVEEYVKPAVLKKIDRNQFGTVPKSCTVYALISMLHSWYRNTDGNGSTVRVVLVDFEKAFDLIDHWILLNKLKEYDLPIWTFQWIADFLRNREQRVKLAQDCHSEWGSVPAGVPQGTKLGPWLFVVMINNLHADGFDLWKYVDDTTITETVHKNDSSHIQTAVDKLVQETQANRFQINESKCKELQISFSKSRDHVFPAVVINNKSIEVVNHAKLLGLTISDDLKWNTHISEVVKKVASRLYFLRQLKRAKVTQVDLLSFYVTCIRPVTEYACQVFHNGLPAYLSDELEKLQRRALRIIYPDLSYTEALTKSNLSKLHTRRNELTERLFNDIVQDNSHKLHPLLPVLNSCPKSLRSKRKFLIPLCKTNRYKRSFIMYNAATIKY